MHERRLHVGMLTLLATIGVVGCITIDIPEQVSLLSTGTSFVVSGTAALEDTDGLCLVWIGDNGIVYHLFQNPRVDNETFDRITTPGVTSRLEIATRTDLELACQIGTIVEVQDVLDIED